MTPDDAADRFLGIPTGNLADALVECDAGGGVLHNLRPLTAEQPSFAGWAYPVQQEQKLRPAEPGRTRHAEVIDSLSSPGDVIVIDVNGRTDVCSLGALLAERGRVRGLAGFVVNGSVRDVADIGRTGFPVHCVGSSPAKSSVALDTTAINEPVTIAGTLVSPGDLIVADDTGVVCIPRAVMAQVLEAALRIKDRETRAAERLARGASLAEALDG